MRDEQLIELRRQMRWWLEARADETAGLLETLVAVDTENPPGRSLMGRDPRFELCPGSLDTRWYAQLGIPAFAYGAGRLDVSHGAEEYIDHAAMIRCAAVYALFADKMLR